MKFLRVALAVAATMSLCPPSSNAAAVVAAGSYEPSDLVSQAELICTATVVSTSCRWKADYRGRHIYTQVRLSIEQWIKGRGPGTSLDLEVVGGAVGGTIEMVSDTPVFIRGERVLLFLRGSPLHVVGGAMGKLPVVGDQVFWDGRSISIDMFAGELGLGRVQVLEEPDEAATAEPNGVGPEITAIEPAIASAGTDTEVSIVGTRFGQAQGSGSVAFIYRVGILKIAAPVLSWSDTRIVCTVPAGVIASYPASAGSGPVTVITDEGTSDGSPFRVTFGTFGNGLVRWAGERSAIQYYVNENARDCDGELDAVEAAAATWNSTGAAFRFEYAGPHTGTVADENGKSEVLWSAVDTIYGAVTYWRFSDSEGGTLLLDECDVVFNDGDPRYSWSTRRVAGDGVVGKADVQTMAIHEFGHWLPLLDLYGSLDDEYDKAKAMYGIARAHSPAKKEDQGYLEWDVMRTLHPDDVAGIHYLYPPAEPPVMPAQIDYPSVSDTGAFTVTWGASPQASSYELDRSDDGGTTWVRVYTGPHTSFAESSALRGAYGHYRYRSRASNVAGSSPWQTGARDCAVNGWMGKGDANEPYLIYTAEELNKIGAQEPDTSKVNSPGAGDAFLDKHFKLMADIDLSGFDGKGGRPAFNLIGREYRNSKYMIISTPFTGVFDGNGHTISHLTIKGEEGLGLFGELASGAEVRDLSIVDVNVTSTGQMMWETGGLVGRNAGTVTRCYSTGTVTGMWRVGGLVGWNLGAVVESCSAAEVHTAWRFGGGVVGDNSGDVVRCYSTGTVRGGSYIGGLVGLDSGNVTDCYSTGAVSGSMYVGGLAGRNTAVIARCYSTGLVAGESLAGGVVGHNEDCAPGYAGCRQGTVTACFWDIKTSGTLDGIGNVDPDGSGATGRITTELWTARVFLDVLWDFAGEANNGSEGIWMICEGKDYPRLRWENVDCAK